MQMKTCGECLLKYRPVEDILRLMIRKAGMKMRVKHANRFGMGKICKDFQLKTAPGQRLLWVRCSRLYPVHLLTSLYETEMLKHWNNTTRRIETIKCVPVIIFLTDRWQCCTSTQRNSDARIACAVRPNIYSFVNLSKVCIGLTPCLFSKVFGLNEGTTFFPRRCVSQCFYLACYLLSS